MKILIDARYLDGSFSGIGTYSQNLIENLSRVDSENEYYVLVRPGFGAGLTVGPNFRMISYSPKPVSVATLAALGNYIDSLRVDLVHSLFPLAPLAMRTPLMVTIHDLQPFVDPEFSARRMPWIQLAYRMFYGYAYPAVLKRAKWIISVSYHTQDLVKEFFPAEIPKLIVINSGLDKSLFEPPERDPREVQKRYQLQRPYLLYYGSTRPNKNLLNIVRGFDLLIRQAEEEDTDLLLIVKKDRFYRDVERVIKNLDRESRVRVLDQIPPADQRAILGSARVFLFPTKYEGFGFPALEAMAAGVPVIAGRSGALPEICGNAAEFVNPDEPEDIAAALIRILGSASLREDLIARGHARAHQFDWREAAERVRDIYRLLC